ncbi:MAG: glycosyltransferase family 1 protein [Rhodobacter sp.]|nr:glycosyltransferase family 1 protein [Rhodobacter sp.]
MDLIGRFRWKSSADRRRAEADARRMSISRRRKGGLRRMLRTTLPKGTAYLNVGHSNLTDEILQGWRDSVGGTINVLVHDVIPLDHPHFQRPAQTDVFRSRMKRVSALADLVIYNSTATRTDAERWFGNWGRTPDGVVAHLGVEPFRPDMSQLPADLPLDRPYFVTLGTVEPRKNHALLLDVWEAMAAETAIEDLPSLVIVGTRGWANEALFKRLDTTPLRGRALFEYSGLDDRAAAGLLSGSAGLLFPSLAEGFGLPPLEAAALGVPVVVCDLPIYRETLGNIPVYLDSGDVYSWMQITKQLAEKRQAERERTGTPSPATGIPTWTDHFNLVLKVT